eukprot:GHVS01014795.1.p1 GENE.GHVS01014795.1~~GHVS01014795.1.p1  ORF type:complete len:356 (+),score=92.68 GHVS01014795.1:53-1069(+)
MPGLFLFQCEFAKSGRSKCKGCSGAIEKASLRVGVSQRRESGEGGEHEIEEEDIRARAVIESTRWFHPMCLCKFRTSKNWWRQHLVDGFEEIEGPGVGGIGDDNRLMLKLLMKTLRRDEDGKNMMEDNDDGDGLGETANDNNTTNITTTPTSSSRERRKTKKQQPSEGIAAVADKQQKDDKTSPKHNKTPSPAKRSSPTIFIAGNKAGSSPKKFVKTSASSLPTTTTHTYSPGVVSAAHVAAIEANMLALRVKSVLQLQEMLRMNKQKLGGNRADVVERVAECMALGSIPKCESCGGGFLKFSPVTGVYSCPGYHDEDRFVACKFTTKEVERIPWING